MSRATASAPSFTAPDGGRPAPAAGERGRRLRLPADRTDRAALVGLVLILAVATVLRALFMVAWSPAFMGFPDASAYVAMASGALWADPTHEVGYAVFLRDLHAVVGQLWLPIVMQHIFGLVSAVLFWAIARRSGIRSWLALLPAAVVALNGGQMFLEHSTLSESFYILLLAAGLYFAVRTLGSSNPGWAALAGLALTLGWTVRVVALPLIVVVLVWLLLVAGDSWRNRIRAAACSLGVIVVVMGGYVVAQHQATGYWGVTTPAGAWNLYSRVAPFADCHKFTPPPGTQGLCESTPPEHRWETVADYSYDPRSPAVQGFSWGDGPISAGSEDNKRIASFTRAVIEHQPVDYLKAVLEGVVANVKPMRLEFRTHDELGPGYQLFFHKLLFDPSTLAIAAHKRLPYYGLHSFTQDHGLMRFLWGYESLSRVDGVLMGLLLVLSLFGLFAPRGRPRQIGWLMFSLTWVALIVPPATHWWDARYVIPALGTLSASAAIGAWQVGRVMRRVRLGRAARRPVQAPA